MALLEGKKRWLLYPKKDAPLLYPVWPEGCHDPVFEAQLDQPDAVQTPAALLAKGASYVLEAGAFRVFPGCAVDAANLRLLCIGRLFPCPSYIPNIKAPLELFFTREASVQLGALKAAAHDLGSTARPGTYVVLQARRLNGIATFSRLHSEIFHVSSI